MHLGRFSGSGCCLGLAGWSASSLCLGGAIRFGRCRGGRGGRGGCDLLEERRKDFLAVRLLAHVGAALVQADAEAVVVLRMLFQVILAL